MASREAWEAPYREALTQRLGCELFEIGTDHLGFCDGEIAFLIPAYLDDPSYLELVVPFPSGYPARDLGRDVVMGACSSITRRIKGAQATVGDDGDLRVAIEMFVGQAGCIPTVDALVAVMPRALELLKYGSHSLLESLRFLEVTQGVEAPDRQDP